MPRSLAKSKVEDFEPKKRNPLGLLDDSNLDSHLKSLKIGDKLSPIEISDNEVRIDADFSLNGKLKTHKIATDNEYLDFQTGTAGYIQFSAQGSSIFQLYPSGNDLYWLLPEHEYHYLDSSTALFTIFAKESGGDWRSLFTLNAASNSLSLFDDADTGDKLVIAVDAAGASSITTTDDDGTAAHLTLDIDGDITLDAAGNDIGIDNAGTTFGTINTGTAGKLKFISSSNYNVELHSQGTGDINLNSADNIRIDAVDSITLDGDGTYIMMKDGTEFSAANSAYAGMILGYTDIGLDEIHATYNLTTSLVVPTDEFSVSFVAPPSGNVEIFIQIGFYAGSAGAGDLTAGLSTANATSGYSTVDVIHEEVLLDGKGRNEIQEVNHYWTLTGLTAGTAYERWVGFKSTSTSGTPQVQWGGNSESRFPDFIMKATALPSTITT